MKSNRIIVIVLALAAVAAFVIYKSGNNGNGDNNGPGGNGGVTDVNPETVKVGVLTILTGEASSYGEYTKQGLELALQEIESPGFELVYKDTKADPAEAVRVFKELQRDNVPIIIGPFTSTEVRQVGPEAQRTSTTLITSSATADQLSAIGDRVFMMLPPNSQQGADQARFAAKGLTAKSAAILYRQNPYGETLRKSFRETFEAEGGEILKELGFPDGEENFRDRLKELAETNPEVIFIPCHDADTGRILRQAKEVNIPDSVRFLGCDGSMSETMLELAGDAAEGSIFSNVASISDSFDASYDSAYGGAPSPYAASSYDTLKIIAGLVSSGAKSSDDFQTGLAELSAHDGATGPTSFSKVEKSYWALSKSYSQFEVRGGKFELRR